MRILVRDPQPQFPLFHLKSLEATVCGSSSGTYMVVFRIRIRKFLGPLDPDPLFRGTDLDQDPSVIK
jgi:hypothetical protein